MLSLITTKIHYVLATPKPSSSKSGLTHMIFMFEKNMNNAGVIKSLILLQLTWGLPHVPLVRRSQSFRVVLYINHTMQSCGSGGLANVFYFLSKKFMSKDSMIFFSFISIPLLNSRLEFKCLRLSLSNM